MMPLDALIHAGFSMTEALSRCRPNGGESPFVRRRSRSAWKGRKKVRADAIGCRLFGGWDAKLEISEYFQLTHSKARRC